MSSVYPREVDKTSTSKADIDAGQEILSLRFSPDGKIYRLVKAVANIPDGHLVGQDTAGGAAVGDVDLAATDGALGVNNTGKQVNSGEYFWALCSGPGYVYASGAVSAGVPVVVDAANAGQVKTSAGTAEDVPAMPTASVASGNVTAVIKMV